MSAAPITMAEILTVSDNSAAEVRNMAAAYVRAINAVAKHELATVPKSARLQGQVGMALGPVLIEILKQSGMIEMANSPRSQQDDMIDLFQWVIGAIGSTTGKSLALSALGPFAGHARDTFLSAFDLGDEMAQEGAIARDPKDAH